MSCEIIDIRSRHVTRAELPEFTVQPMDLSDPLQEADVLRECRRYSMAVFARCTGTPTNAELASAINIASSVSSILQSLAAGRMARQATEQAKAISEACRQAIEQAERL